MVASNSRARASIACTLASLGLALLVLPLAVEAAVHHRSAFCGEGSGCTGVLTVSYALWLSPLVIATSSVGLVLARRARRWADPGQTGWGRSEVLAGALLVWGILALLLGYPLVVALGYWR